MTTLLTMTELRSMNSKDLLREIQSRRAAIGAFRLTISIGKEKNTSLHRKAKRELARLLTVVREKEQTKPLNRKENTATVRAQV